MLNNSNPIFFLSSTTICVFFLIFHIIKAGVFNGQRFMNKLFCSDGIIISSVILESNISTSNKSILQRWQMAIEKVIYHEPIPEINPKDHHAQPTRGGGWVETAEEHEDELVRTRRAQRRVLLALPSRRRCDLLRGLPKVITSSTLNDHNHHNHHHIMQTFHQT